MSIQMNNIDITKSKIIANELFVVGTDFADFEVNELILLLQVTDDLYFNGQGSFIDDAQYDILKQVTYKLDDMNPYFIGVGSEVRGGKIRLPHQMGSLVQSYEGDVEKWVEKYSLQTERVTISDKLDGVSALIVYGNKQFQIGYSRGDGTNGADISRHLRKFDSVPKTINDSAIIAIRGEVIISKSNFVELCNQMMVRKTRDVYKNARNAASGIMNSSSNPDWMYEYIDFVAYEIVDPSYISKDTQLERLQHNGFNIVKSGTYNGETLNDVSLADVLADRRANTEYDIDGIVLDVTDVDVRKRINPSKDTLNPEYARKYKIAESSNYAETTVLDVELNVSKTGYIKPTIVFEPVDLAGVTISRCTGFNMKYISTNNIQPGCKISITRQGDVIPMILGVVEHKNVSSFGDWFNEKLDGIGVWKWTDTMVDVYLTNDHPDIALEKTKDFFVTIDAPILREGNIIKLFEAGFDTPSDIIKMSKVQMISVLGENGKKAYEGLRLKLTNIPIYLLMSASGMFGRGIGTRKLKKLYEAAGGDISKFNDREFICRVEGFEDKTAVRIMSGKDQWNTFFTDIMEYVTLKPYDVAKVVEGKLTGQVYVFTGIRDKVLEQKVIDAGGVISSTYSKQVTCVVAKDPSDSSSKLQKARKDGINVIGISEMYGMVE
jgi:DNA ligase (NAD+)